MGRDCMGKSEIADEARAVQRAERKWWLSFRRVLNQMPETVELNARVGAIGISAAGSRRIRFHVEGDADNFSEDEWAEVSVPRLDGRDSHL